MTFEFKPWPKIARLNRDIVITEKIDGTNAAVIIEPVDPDQIPNVLYDGDRPKRSWAFSQTSAGDYLAAFVDTLAGSFFVGAQSRTRLIAPEQDNFGFAEWVFSNAQSLAEVLGEGTHFGEWWGHGIQRGYGLPKGERRFSLFNTKRWFHSWDYGFPAGLGVVPVLYEGPFYQDEIDYVLKDLRERGSKAAPFMNPEGIVVYHTAANQMFKITLAGDEAPKSVKAA